MLNSPDLCTTCRYAGDYSMCDSECCSVKESWGFRHLERNREKLSGILMEIEEWPKGKSWQDLFEFIEGWEVHDNEPTE